MTAAQAAGAGDAVGLEAWQRRGERLDAGEMRAIGADPADDLDAAVEESAMSRRCTAAAIALARLTRVRSSASARRSRTAAMSAVVRTVSSSRANDAVSSSRGVTR